MTRSVARASVRACGRWRRRRAASTTASDSSKWPTSAPLGLGRGRRRAAASTTREVLLDGRARCARAVRKSCIRTMRMRSLTSWSSVDRALRCRRLPPGARGSPRRAARTRRRPRRRPRVRRGRASRPARRDQRVASCGGPPLVGPADGAALEGEAHLVELPDQVEVGERSGRSRRRAGARRAPRCAAATAPRGPACGTRRARRRGAPRRGAVPAGSRPASSRCFSDLVRELAPRDSPVSAAVYTQVNVGIGDIAAVSAP